MAAPKKPTTGELLKALGSDERVTILKLYAPARGTKPELSAKLISGQMRKPLPNVAYHVAALRDVGLLKLVRQEPRRGAMENFLAITAVGERALDLIQQAERIRR